MSAPAISIVLPAYNCGDFLTLCLDSLLQQTFTDFELIIINDGSTDSTEKIIRTYADPRIRYIKNETNVGLITTLNKGIGLAKGKYIARMDADDICQPERLSKQKAWLDANPKVDVVGCHIALINQAGEDAGSWQDDLDTPNAETLKAKMAQVNCLAHPTVMLREEIAKAYGYNFYQQHTEDYDLWLRLLADGKVIDKIPEKLLLYRVHDQSITGSILRKTNPYLKQYHCKRKFLQHRIREKKLGWFARQVFFSMVRDGIMGIGKQVKNKTRF